MNPRLVAAALAVALPLPLLAQTQQIRPPIAVHWMSAETAGGMGMDLPPGEEDPLTAELSSFLQAVRDGKPPAVDAQAGFAAVDAAQRVVEAIRAHHWDGLAMQKV